MQVSISSAYNKARDKKMVFHLACQSLHPEDLSLDELLEHINEEKVWSNIIWSGVRKTENFLSADSVAVDVDEGLPLDKMLSQLSSAGVNPNLWYYSQSHTPEKPKYRLVWTLGEPVGFQVYKLLVNMLVSLCGADVMCVDGARVWLGSAVGGAVIHREPLDLLAILTAWYAQQEVKGTKRDAVKALQSKTSIATVNGWLAIRPSQGVGVVSDDVISNSSSVSGSPIRNNIIGVPQRREQLSIYTTQPAIDISWQTYGQYEIGFSLHPSDFKQLKEGQRGQVSTKPVKFKTDRELIDGYDWALLKSRCRYYRELIDGDIPYIHRSDCLPLALTFANIKGGSTRYRKIINLTASSSENESQRIQIFNWASSVNPTAPGCKSFCPHHSKCTASRGTMLRTGQDGKEVTRITPLAQILKDEARQTLVEHFNVAESSPVPSVTVISCPPGLGKTREIINRFRAGCLIAVPTHALAQQILDDLVKSGLDRRLITYVTERPRLYPESCTDAALIELEMWAVSAERCGDHNTVVECCNAAKEKLELLESRDWVGDRRTYQDVIDDISLYQSSRLEARTASMIVCTHAYLLCSSLSAFRNINTVYIDEDICPAAYKFLELTDKEARTIYNVTTNHSLKGLLQSGLTSPSPEDIREGLSGVIKSPLMHFIRVDLNKDDLKILAQLRTKIRKPLELLMHACVITRTDKGLVVLNTSKVTVGEKRVILTSATPATSRQISSVFSYSAPQYLEVPDVELEGSIVYHPIATYRKNLKDPAVRKKIGDEAKALGLDYLITFKEFKDDFEKMGFECPVHFGNELGINSMVGVKAFAVVGDYIENPTAIHQIIASIKEATIEQLAPAYMLQEFKGIRYFAAGYRDETTNEYVQAKTREHLGQSVGRGRLIDNPVTVHLWGITPHPQSSNI